MGVTLQVISANAHKLGGRSELEFASSGTIGRSDDNTLVLPDPERFISSRHAAIDVRADGTYLKDTSINGTFVNGADQPIGHGNDYRLEEGDRIRIGEFEFVAVLKEVQSQSSEWPQTSQSSQWPSSASDPWGDATPTPTPTPMADPLGPGEVDPLKVFPGQSGPASPAPQPPSAPVSDQPAHGMGNFTPPRTSQDPFAPSTDPFAQKSDPFASNTDPLAVPLSPPAAPASGGGSVIPEDWDKTSMPSALRQPAAPQAEPPAPMPGGQAGWNEQPQGMPAPGQGAPAVPNGADPFAAQRPQQPQQPGFPPPGPQGAAHPGIPPAQQNAPGQVPPDPRAQPQPPAPTPGGFQQPAAVGDGSLAALLEAAGLDQATARALDNPATGQAIGIVLRIMVRELMEVLHARAEVKNQFRVAMTQMAPTENNPLKFCADDIDALTRLLVQDGRGFLGMVDAVGEGFEDVKAHQMAMMAGMRAAFDHLLARFDPKALRREFDQELRRSDLFKPLNKNKYWDMLEDLYADISRDSDANFARLFGDEFARAYEEQMEQLSRHRRH